MTDQITWLLANDGAFIVRSKAGNFSYAYPTSPNAYRAKKDVAGKDRRHVAISMATQADMDVGWCPADIVATHNRYVGGEFDAARGRTGTLLGKIDNAA
jgi:hypothetical protein